MLDNSIDSALEGHGVVKSPVVSMKMSVKDKLRPAKTSNMVRHTTPPMVGDEVVRIINECDPLQFLMDVMQGKAIETHVVDEQGLVHTEYQTPTLPQRIKIATNLVDKYIPKVAVMRHSHLIKNVDDDKPTNKPEDGKRNHQQIVEHAAQQAEADSAPTSDE